ncbi:MAG: hypothetical protein KJZ65_09450 [Phycisphaerales bacterium]|nr:hypothetical protein [Phycisphaerales bacterium]
MKSCVGIAMLALLGGCAATKTGQADRARPTEVEQPRQAGQFQFIEIFPGVRVDAGAGVVEIDARVATDVHDPRTPDVFLELVACTRDTREYESLVVIDPTAAQVHAGLLLIGLEPGSPGRWQREGDRVVPIEPRGEPVRVRLIYEGAHGPTEAAVEDWIRVRREGGASEPMPTMDFVFAGSGFRVLQGAERYLGDVEGTVIGLTTFGTEVIAPRAMHHPSAQIENPSLLARNEVMPKVNEPVVVRVQRVRDRSAPGS